MKRINLLIPLMIFALIFTNGCFLLDLFNLEKEEPLVISLEETTINNGNYTNLKIIGKNIGSDFLNLSIKIIPEDNEMINLDYNGLNSLNYLLTPNDSFERNVKIIGKTMYFSSQYKITVQLINQNNQNRLSEKEIFLTVKK